VSDGIRIPREVAEAEGVPDDLNADVLEPYTIPDPGRRRLAGLIYICFAVVLGAAGFIANAGWWWAAGLLLIIAIWHFLAAWPLHVPQEEALRIAARSVNFAIGHASAAVTFVGWRSRPRWHVIVYSGEEPPARRALVEIDALNGTTVEEPYIEELGESAD